MFRCRTIHLFIICLTLLESAAWTYAEEIEDSVDIMEAKGRILAVIEGRRTVTFDLRPKENVIWSGSKGLLGTFLTRKRLFVISTASGAWQIYPLKPDESSGSVAMLSPYLALLITKNRAVAFDALSGGTGSPDND